MGQQTRYRVKMFDTNYRVEIESQDGGKAHVIGNSDVLADADAIYDLTVAQCAGSSQVVMLMQGTRIMRRSDRA